MNEETSSVDQINEDFRMNEETSSVDQINEDFGMNEETSSADQVNKEDDIEKDIHYQISGPSKTVYSDKSIKFLLKHYLPNVNIEEVYLYKTTIHHVFYKSIFNLKTKLIHEIEDEEESSDKFYLIIEQSANSDLKVSSAHMLHLCGKKNISVFTFVGLIPHLLLNELCKAPEIRGVYINSYWIPPMFHVYGSLIENIDYLIEIIKLSLDYKAHFDVPEDEIKEIMSIPSEAYEKSHQELLDTLKRNELSSDDKDKVTENERARKGVSWDSMVKDNEGRTKRSKKKKFKKRRNTERVTECMFLMFLSAVFIFNVNRIL